MAFTAHLGKSKFIFESGHETNNSTFTSLAADFLNTYLRVSLTKSEKLFKNKETHTRTNETGKWVVAGSFKKTLLALK